VADSSTAAVPLPTEAPEAITHRRLMFIIAALLLGMTLASLDQTVVATALPTIAGDLHGLSHLSWVVTAYLLASTVSTPLWGKLGDLYGRKIFFVAGIVIFLVGSALSGLSGSMIELILFRALQGLGAGGLMIGAQTIIADVVSPRDRGKYQGLFGAVFGVTSVIGPLVGGFFVTSLSWRWVFYINLPIGAVALIVTIIVLPNTSTRVHHVIDYLGTALLAAAATGLVLLTTLAGNTYKWASAPIIILGVGSVVLIILFVLVERRAAEPVLPLHLFANRVFTTSSILGFVVGFAMFGAITYLPQYMQIVRGASPTQSGLDLLPLMAGLLLTSITSGLLITKWGRYKVFPVVGTALMTIGMYLLSRLAVGTGTVTSSIYMFVLGVGIGGVMQVLVIAVQNAVPYKDLGVATSGATFFRSIGGSFGTAIFGAIFASQLDKNLVHFLAGTPVPAGFHGSAGASPASLAKLPATVHAGYIQAFSTSLHTVFLVATPIAAVGFVVALFLKEVPLRKTTQATDPADSLAPSAKPAVRSSLDEVDRALTVLMSRESKVNAYERLATRAGLDLDPQSTWMLLRLNEHSDGDLDQVARVQGMSSDALAPLIRALSDRGLATPAAMDGGSGSAPVTLTDQGRIYATALVTAQREVLADMVGDWSPEEHTELATLLTRLANQLVDDPLPAR